MRQIKFRGKDIETGEWIYGSLVQPIGKNPSIYVQDVKTEGVASFFVYDVEESTVGQFTGLLDKNGKEIYEGDVVRFIDYTYTPLDGLKHEGYIAYNKGYFEIVVGDNLRYCLHSLQLWVYNHCEVIGNIYDNP